VIQVIGWASSEVYTLQSAEEVEKALALGANEFVHKPGDLSSFMKAIQQMIGKFIPKP
jgi:DNA-binding NarL/FixJ family response regulator